MGNVPSIIAGPSSLETCLKSAMPSSQVAGPSKVDYLLTDVKPFNLAIPVKPVAVTYPTSAEQVAAAVKCATKYNVKVQGKSGGHSYANFGK
jgi:FAD/FMN-containing dehydrogenase